MQNLNIVYFQEQMHDFVTGKYILWTFETFKPHLAILISYAFDLMKSFTRVNCITNWQFIEDPIMPYYLDDFR